MRLVGRAEIAEAGPERHASWLELFFDLVFVVSVAAVARILHDDLSPRGLLIFALLFVPVWWQWIDFSYFLDQFALEALIDRLLLFAVMFAVIALAIAEPGAAQGRSTPFVLAILALRALMIWYYWRAWRSVPESRELTGRYLLSFAVAFVVWAVSLAVPAPARYVLWGIAQTIEIANGPITYVTIRTVPRQVSHMDERFGLFVIIVLGEAVLQVAAGIAGVQWQWRGAMVGVAAFVIAGSAWWLYFQRADTSVIHRALRSDRHGLIWSYIYGYSHFFVFAGIAAAAVGAEIAIMAAPGRDLAGGAALALGAGLVAFLLGATALQWATPASLPGAVLALRLAGAVAVGLIALGAVRIEPAVSLPAAALVLVLLAVADARWLKAPDTANAGEATRAGGEGERLPAVPPP